MVEQHEKVKNDDRPSKLMLHPRDMISNLDMWNGLTNKMYKRRKEMESRHITSMVVICHGLINANKFETTSHKLKQSHRRKNLHIYIKFLKY